MEGYGNIAIHAVLAPIDPQHHALAIDVAHLQAAQFAAPESGCVHRQECRSSAFCLQGDKPDNGEDRQVLDDRAASVRAGGTLPPHVDKNGSLFPS